MNRSLFRNMLALIGFCLFINVVVGVPFEASLPMFCEVNGHFYREGEHFISSNNPDLMCQCQRGYTGDNIKPFCSPIEHESKNPENDLRSMDDCVRITTNSESPKFTHYTELYRCPSDKAVMPIFMTNNLRQSTDERSICTFGHKKLGIGDFFYHSLMDDTRNCVKCTCEQPPKPTCVRPASCPLVHVG